jgi:large subunit ribosomal protein L26e
VVQVYRLKYIIHIEGVTREKCNGQSIHIPIRTNNIVITKLHLDKNREEKLKRRGEGRAKALQKRQDLIAEAEAIMNSAE